MTSFDGLASYDVIRKKIAVQAEGYLMSIDLFRRAISARKSHGRVFIRSNPTFPRASGLWLRLWVGGLKLSGIVSFGIYNLILHSMNSCSLVVWNTIVSRISFGHEKNRTFEHFSKTLLNDLSNFPPAEWKTRPCYTKQFFLQLATQRWRIQNLSSCRGDATRTQLVSQRCEK